MRVERPRGVHAYVRTAVFATPNRGVAKRLPRFALEIENR